MRRLILIALLLPFVGACQPATSGTASSFPGAPVVLISIDTLRSDRLPVYGYSVGETPAIDALAADSLLFERAYSHVPLTLPSHASMLTGVLPDRLGVRDNQGYPVPAGVPTLAELLSGRGYATAAAVSSYVLRREAGLARGFELYDEPRETRSDTALGALARPASATLAALDPWLDEVAERPFFLFVHFYEPHAPYMPPEPYASRHTDPYDGEVAAADDAVGKLLEQLRSRGAYDRSIILLTSDHGEGLGDHREQEHGVFLYREALQVPLLLKLPGDRRGGERLDRPAQLIDVVPTVLRLTETPSPTGLVGADLLDLPAAPRPILAETAYPRLHYGWSDLASVILGNDHYIEGPRPELFELARDPGELDDRWPGERRLAASLRETLGGLAPLAAPSVAVDEETRRRLAALGYATSTTAATEQELPDPKDRFADLALLRTAFLNAQQGKHELAAVGFQEVLVSSPAMVDAWQYLGLSLAELERFDEALLALGRARALSGDAELDLATAGVLLRAGRLDDAVRQTEAARRAGAIDRPFERQLAVAVARRGRFDDAVSRLQRLLDEGDRDAGATLGLVLSESGDQDGAAARLGELLELEPDHVEALQNLALAELRRHNLEGARRAARHAVEIDEQRPTAWNHLGVAAWLLGSTDEALDAWEHAREHAPDDLEVLFNLGTRAAELGDWQRARPVLEHYAELAADGADRREVRRLLRQGGSR